MEQTAEYIQETMDSGLLQNIFDLPYSYQNRLVEVTIRPVEKAETIKTSIDEVFGCLHQYARPEKIAGEKGAWARAAIEKYAKNRR